MAPLSKLPFHLRVRAPKEAPEQQGLSPRQPAGSASFRGPQSRGLEGNVFVSFYASPGLIYSSPFSLLGGAKAPEVLLAVCPCSAFTRPPPRRSQRSDPPAWTPLPQVAGAPPTAAPGLHQRSAPPPPFAALGTQMGLSRPAGPAGRIPLARATTRPASLCPAWDGGRWRPQSCPYTRRCRRQGCRLSRCKLWSVGQTPGFEEENLFPLNCGRERPHLASSTSSHAPASASPPARGPAATTSSSRLSGQG